MAAKKETTDIIHTKYELAQMVGVRALQISMGAPFGIEFTPEELAELNYNPIAIAKRELAQGAIPLRVLRPDVVTAAQADK